MARPLSIAIIGAGMGGLATAAALRRVGIDVTVYEQATQHLHGVAADLDAGANPRELRRLFIDGDVDTHPPQRRGGREPTHAGADDRNR